MALPSDVRKVFDLPKRTSEILRGYAPETRAEPKWQERFHGRPEAFRTSGGKAANYLSIAVD
jgi:hypothetical protein